MSAFIDKSRWSYMMVHKREHAMEVENFFGWISRKKADTFLEIRSPVYSFGNVEWYSAVICGDNHVKIQLNVTKNKTNKLPLDIHFSLTVRNSKDVDLFCECQKFSADGNQQYIKQSVFSPPKTLLPNERITFHFNVKLYSLEKETIAVPDNDLTTDLLDLFQKTTEFADITLKCKGEHFKAHKAILASRSRVFTAMFKHDLKEIKDGVVDIVDMEADVLREMLQYIYTGEVSNDLNENLAIGLLAAADKYDFERLRVMCEKFLAEKLSTKNAFEMLVRSDTHSAHHLKKAAIQFIKKYKAEIFDTLDWKGIATCNFSHLISELIG